MAIRLHHYFPKSSLSGQIFELVLRDHVYHLLESPLSRLFHQLYLALQKQLARHHEQSLVELYFVLALFERDLEVLKLFLFAFLFEKSYRLRIAFFQLVYCLDSLDFDLLLSELQIDHPLEVLVEFFQALDFKHNHLGLLLQSLPNFRLVRVCHCLVCALDLLHD